MAALRAGGHGNHRAATGKPADLGLPRSLFTQRFRGRRSEVEHLPGSKASFTKAEINNIWFVPDWYPDAHPPMPEVVAHGRKPDVYSCGHCHLPNGQGRPENASVAGLPAEYIIQQMADFKNGLRKASDPEMLSVTNMVKLAKSATDEDVKAAAAYFSSIPSEALDWRRRSGAGAQDQA